MQGLSMANVGAMTVRVPFRVSFNLVSEASGFNSNKLDIHPANLGTVANNIQKNFELYRVTELEMKFVPGTMAVNSEAYQFATAFSSLPYEDETSGPAGMTNMAQFESFNVSGGQSIRLRVPRKVLLRVPSKWYRCSTTGISVADSYIQGSAWIASLYSAAATSALTHICILEGVVDFRGIIDAGDDVPSSLVVPSGAEEEYKKDDESCVVVEPHGLSLPVLRRQVCRSNFDSPSSCPTSRSVLTRLENTKLK